jgi:hypothetical protein
MNKPVNQNFIRASNLIILSALLGVVNFLFLSPPKATFEMIVGIAAIGFVVLIAYLVRKAYQWIKWVLLVLTIIGALGMLVSLPAIIHEDIIVCIISIMGTVLQIIATVLIFLPNNPIKM